MKSFEIQYHKAKNAANKLKHQGISLAETEPVFYDDRALTLQDNHHGEQRWIITGLDAKGRLLVVAYTSATRISCESFPRASPPKTSVATIWRLDR